MTGTTDAVQWETLTERQGAELSAVANATSVRCDRQWPLPPVGHFAIQFAKAKGARVAAGRTHSDQYLPRVWKRRLDIVGLQDFLVAEANRISTGTTLTSSTSTPSEI